MGLGAKIRCCLDAVRRDEAGFTLIELIAALIVVSLGVIALITTLDSSRDLISFSERKESAVHIGQQELERIQALPWDQIAMNATPACVAPCDANNPGYYIEGGWYRWDQQPSGEKCSASGAPALKCERLVTGGAVSSAIEERTEPGPTGGTRLKVEMHRFVTWVDDDCVKDPPNVAGCTNPAQGDYKRITVAVRVVGVVNGTRERLLNGGPGRPIILSTTVRNPAG